MAEKKDNISALPIALQFGYTMAIPIVILALVGRLLDNRFDTSPWLLLIGIVLSVVISSIGLVMKFNNILRQIENAQPKKESHQELSNNEPEGGPDNTE